MNHIRLLAAIAPLDSALARLHTAAKYGEDMKDSQNVAIEDTLSLLAETTKLLTKQAQQ